MRPRRGGVRAYVDVRGKLRTTDISAAVLVPDEAGGVVLKPNGDQLMSVPLTAVNRFSLVAAANTGLFHKILQRLEDK